MSPIDIAQWARERFDAVGKQIGKAEDRLDDLEDVMEEHGKTLAVLKDRVALWGIFVLQAVQLVSGWLKPGS